MAQNVIPKSIDTLIALAEDAADGLQQHAAGIGVVQNTEAKLRAETAALQAAQAAHLAARAAKVEKTAAKTLQDSNAKAFLATAVGVLKPALGAQWSSAWEAVGFQNGSLALPATMEERFGLLLAVKAYLTANPARENLPLLITAAQAQTLADANSAARAASNQSNTDAGNAMAAREAAAAALRRRLRALVEELVGLIADDDARWYAFGFNAPADPETPGVPEHLTATPGAPGSLTLYVDWDDSRRAERYHVFTKGAADTQPVPRATVTESNATLTGLTAGPVQVTVTALNDAGESVPSAPLQTTVP
jgi:hypothetical protein